MKKILCILLGCVALQVSAQSLAPYHRSSLATMMVFHDDDAFASDIYEAFDSIPIPDKFDNHNLEDRILLNEYVQGARPYRKGLYKASYGKILTQKQIERNAAAIDSILHAGECAKWMVAKWFGLQGTTLQNATFDTKLIQSRGLYAASDMDVQTAMQTIRGKAILADAGEELLGQTYLMVNDITYVTAEERATVAKVVLAVLLGLLGVDAQTVMDVASLCDNFTGFTVRTHSYLFQLDWNEEVANKFYTDYYTTVPNPERMKAFLQDSTTFRLKYVAHEFEFDDKTTFVGTYTRPELMKIICTRSMDKNLAALQKQYTPFRVKTPVYSVVEKDGRTYYAAKIGLKEGVSPTSRYDVVLPEIDPATYRTKYTYIASLKPCPNAIWDNQYSADQEDVWGDNTPEEIAQRETSYTLFEKITGTDIRPGYLLIEK